MRSDKTRTRSLFADLRSYDFLVKKSFPLLKTTANVYQGLQEAFYQRANVRHSVQFRKRLRTIRACFRILRHTKWRDDLCIQCNAFSVPLYNLAEAFAVFFEWKSGQDVKRDPQLRARRNSRPGKRTRTEAIFNTIKSWTNGNKFCTLLVTTLCSLM